MENLAKYIFESLNSFIDSGQSKQSGKLRGGVWQ